MQTPIAHLQCLTVAPRGNMRCGPSDMAEMEPAIFIRLDKVVDTLEQGRDSYSMYHVSHSGTRPPPPMITRELVQMPIGQIALYLGGEQRQLFFIDQMLC